MIYFIKAEGTEFIKIGRSGGDATGANHRKAGLQVGCPHRLKIVGLMAEGPRWDEAKAQGRFSKDRVRGEWFKSTIKLAKFICKHCFWFARQLPDPRVPAGYASVQVTLGEECWFWHSRTHGYRGFYNGLRENPDDDFTATALCLEAMLNAVQRIDAVNIRFLLPDPYAVSVVNLHPEVLRNGKMRAGDRPLRSVLGWSRLAQAVMLRCRSVSAVLYEDQDFDRVVRNGHHQEESNEERDGGTPRFCQVA